MAFKENLTLDAEVQTRVNATAIHDIGIALMHAGDEAKAHWEKIFTGKPVEQVLRTRWEVDSSGVSKLKSEIKSVTPIMDQLAGMTKNKFKSEEGSVTKLRQQVNTYTQMRDGIAKIDQSTGQVSKRWLEANDNVKKAALGLAEAQGNIMGMAKVKLPFLSEFMSLGNALNQIGAIIGTVVSAFQALSAAFQPLIDRAKQIEGFKLALGQFVPTMDHVNAAFQNSKAISLELGLSLTQVEKGYKRMTPTIMSAGGSMSDVDETMKALGARTVTLGLNSEQSGRYFEAFAQVMGKGTLQSEELNQQFSELDGALRAQLSSYFAMNEGIYNLSEAMKNGEISATMFREAFVDMNADAVRELEERVKGVVYSVETLGEEGGITVQQLENMKSTLDTITMEKLVEDSNGFGKSIQAIGLHWSKFWASSAQRFTAISKSVEGILSTLGGLFELLSHVAGVITKIVAAVAEILLRATGIGEAFEGLGEVIQFAAKGWRIIADLMNPVNTETQKIAEGTAEIKDVTAMNTKELERYVGTLVQAQQEAEKLRDAAKAKYDEEVKKLEELRTKMNEIYKEEQEAIKESINVLKEKQTTTKEQYSEKIEAEKKYHSDVMEGLKQQLSAVKEKYSAELEAVNALTPAQQEQARLRKQKLIDITKSSKSTREEKIDAQAQLDTMRQQAESQKIKQKQLAEEKIIKAQIAAEEKRHKEAMRQLEEDQKKALGEIKNAIKELANELKASQDKQKDANKQLDDTIELQGEQATSLSEINGLIAEQKTKVTEAKDEYNRTKLAVDEITTAIGLAAKAQEALNAEIARQPGKKASETEAVGRYAGGPVTGGRTYTVNELGVEGFLNSAGRLSEIKAPSWGQWTAPGSGTVIPAGIYAAIKAAQASEARFSGANIASGANGNRALIRAIGGLSGGGAMTNNVTVQAINPSKTASDMLVSLTKIRRRRYS